MQKFIIFSKTSARNSMEVIIHFWYFYSVFWQIVLLTFLSIYLFYPILPYVQILRYRE
jgi:hypothetical protein